MADEQKKDIADIVKANADISLNNIERKLKEQINEQINAEKKALRRCNQMLKKYRKQEDKSPRKAKVQGKLKSMLDNMDKDKLAKTREELANSSESCKDLEEAGKEWLRPQLDKSYEKYGENKMMELTHFDGYAMLEAIEFGVTWKEEQFEKNRIKHCNSISKEQAELEQKFLDEHLDKHGRMPTFLDAIEYGMRLQKEQLMKGAFEFTQKHNDACVLASECLRNNGWFNREHDFNDLFLYLSCVDELFAGKFSGKTKVIVIKED